jgi:hypothetical protein
VPNPERLGHCPGCGRFAPGHTDSLVHGLRSKRLAKVVDAYRVDLIEQLFRERGGRDALDVVSRIAIENYALVCAQHKTIEARLDQDGLFTQTGRRRSAFDMLKAISETIDRLREALPPTLTSPQASTDYVAMDTDQLIERTSAILRGLLELRGNGQPQPQERQDQGPGLPLAQAQDDGPGAPSAGLQSPEPVQALAAQCPYCHQRPCVGPEHPAYDVLHWDDPSEVEKRAKRATQEMMHQLGKPMGHLPDMGSVVEIGR